MGTFKAEVHAWTDMTQDKLEIVFKEAAQRVIAMMQKVRGAGGNLPIDTGFLRSSLVVTLNQPTTGIKVDSDSVFASIYNEGGTTLIILGARLGDSIYAVYTAAYARRMEYGFNGTDSLGRSYNQEGHGFVRLAAQQWDTVVNAVVREVSARKTTFGRRR